MTTPAVDPAKQAAETRSAVIKAARDALPVGTSTPLTGATDPGDGSGYLARWTARIALEKIAGTIATSLAAAAAVEPAPTADGTRTTGAPPVVRILLTQDGSAGDRDAVRTTVLRLLTAHADELATATATVQAAGNGLTPTGDAPAPPDLELWQTAGRFDVMGTWRPPVAEVAAAHLTSAADVVGLLRSEFTVHSSPVAALTAELVTAVAARLLSPDRTPPVQVVLDGLGLATGAGPVGAALDTALRSDGELTAELAALQAQVSQLPEKDTRPVAAAARDAVAAGAAAHAAWTTAFTAITTAPEAGPALLGTALLADTLQDPACPVTHIARLTLDSSGTDSITRKSLFGASGQLTLVGGVTASWLLVANGSGVLTGAGTAHQGWTTHLDLRSTAAHGTAVVGTPSAPPDPPTGRWQQVRAALRPGDEAGSRLLIAGLGVAGILWLLADAAGTILHG